MDRNVAPDQVAQYTWRNRALRWPQGPGRKAGASPVTSHHISSVGFSGMEQQAEVVISVGVGSQIQ
jgi:hypothetical protein